VLDWLVGLVVSLTGVHMPLSSRIVIAAGSVSPRGSAFSPNMPFAMPTAR
jgi:hypothetical protein